MRPIRHIILSLALVVSLGCLVGALRHPEALRVEDLCVAVISALAALFLFLAYLAEYLTRR